MAPEVEIEKRKQAEDTQLGENIDKWKMALTAIAAAAIGGYFVYFGLMVGQPAATDPDKWGAFGDFFGGLMNPIVAFAAFYWLTQSVKLQKQELADTRRELKESAEAQNRLVANGRVSVRLSALAALVSSANDEIAAASQAKSAHLANRPKAGVGISVIAAMNAQVVERFDQQVSEARERRDGYLAEMVRILDSHRDHLG